MGEGRGSPRVGAARSGRCAASRRRGGGLVCGSDSEEGFRQPGGAVLSLSRCVARPGTMDWLIYDNPLVPVRGSHRY
jgi:hypothetical protein